MAQGGKLQQTGDARVNVGALHAEIAAIDQKVFGAGKIRVQTVELADHAKPGFDGQSLLGHVFAEDGDAAAVRGGQAEANAERGGFARAVRADHAQAFTRVKRER